MSAPKKNVFEEAGARRQSNILVEFYRFLTENKKYWMIPIILILLAIGILVILGGTAAAPFIYTLF